jgi:regulatory protein
MVTIKTVEFVRSSACLTLDDNRKIWLTRSAFLESGWAEGLSVETEAFDRFVQLHQYPHALNQAVSMLARRPCSKGEISRNLNQHHYTDEVIELVIYKLEKEKLLDDRDFSELWIQNRIGKYGVRRIRQELRRKGIPEGTADEALSRVSDEQQLENATVLAVKAWSKTKSGEDPRKSRQKIIASLVRKGYGWDIAIQAVDSASQTES